MFALVQKYGFLRFEEMFGLGMPAEKNLGKIQQIASVFGQNIAGLMGKRPQILAGNICG
jgi:hypothetical protein